MIYLLLEVTGVRPTEEQALASRGDLYRDYQRRVSRLLPWPRGGVDGTALAMRLLNTGFVPDGLIRSGIRRLLARRLAEEGAGTVEGRQLRHMALVEALRTSPLAIHTEAANAQHYEVPAEFFAAVLGPRLKYSSALYADGSDDLAAAEEAMLELTVERACVRDGDDILELGCGWGSLTLFMAERFPRSRITAVSNSHSQRDFIRARAAQRGLRNVEVLTCDVNVLDFPASRQFDRVVSVEMFEHLRNYQQLFACIARWLKPGGTLFVHIFVHRQHAYTFEARDSSDFMARHFFTGGLMPSDALLLYFQGALALRRHWHVDGTHYQRTAESWLRNMDRHREALAPLFRRVYGDAAARRWWTWWRVFFMSCAELWGYAGGKEWFVAHYQFEKPAALAAGSGR
jgi:cyclopropane-fatty-acyl-phospholipid synthase